jgi:hypothetical protein
VRQRGKLAGSRHKVALYTISDSHRQWMVCRRGRQGRTAPGCDEGHLQRPSRAAYCLLVLHAAWRTLGASLRGFTKQDAAQASRKQRSWPVRYSPRMASSSALEALRHARLAKPD